MWILFSGELIVKRIFASPYGSRFTLNSLSMVLRLTVRYHFTVNSLYTLLYFTIWIPSYGEFTVSGALFHQTELVLW